MDIISGLNLKQLTTFRVGGEARFFCTIKDLTDVIGAIKHVKDRSLDFFVIGGGSNILVSDKGFDGLVMKVDIRGIDYKNTGNKVFVRVGAGEDWDHLVEETLKKGLNGLENLSYIPGTVGASPVQNIGAYGVEVKDFIYDVEVFDIVNNNIKILNKEQCQFSYRNSLFKKEKGRYIILYVTFLLNKDNPINISYKDLKDYFIDKDALKLNHTDIRNAVINIRKNKLPDIRECGTAGSFFKNPIVSKDKSLELLSKWPELPIYPYKDGLVKVSAAWIIDKVCGYKGIIKGNVGTYKNQSLVLINTGQATAKDIDNFAKDIEKKVKDKTGIDIEREVEWVGKL